ncbi:MAG: signal peptidase II [Oceanicaulis sp.]
MKPLFSRRRPSAGLALFGFAVALIVFVADQASKLWILHTVDLDRFCPAPGPCDRLTSNSIPVIEPIFNLTMVWNRGVSFGLFAADSDWQRFILIAVSLIISGFLAVWMFSATRRLQALAFGMIIGGAIGNVVDRFFYGAVADFLDFSGLYFPYVFNIADAGISVGVAVLLLDLVLHGDKDR